MQGMSINDGYRRKSNVKRYFIIAFIAFVILAFILVIILPVSLIPVYQLDFSQNVPQINVTSSLDNTTDFNSDYSTLITEKTDLSTLSTENTTAWTTFENTGETEITTDVTGVHTTEPTNSNLDTTDQTKSTNSNLDTTDPTEPDNKN